MTELRPTIKLFSSALFALKQNCDLKSTLYNITQELVATHPDLTDIERTVITNMLLEIAETEPVL